jgi:hypothetical protein
MAVKKQNRGIKDDGGTPKGPCVDCGNKEGPFHTVLRVAPSGKRKMVRVCSKGC